MHLTYIGPHEGGVELENEAGRLLTVKPGEQIEVGTELGAALLEQPTNWEKAGKPTGKPAGKPTGKAGKPADDVAAGVADEEDK